MLKHDELIAVITAEWPDFIHGKDFWVGHPVAESSDEQIGPAFIVAWSANDVDEPEGEILGALITKHQAAIDAVNTPKPADVIRERERRLALGFDYDFGDERGVHRIGTTEADMKGWDEVTQFSNAAVATGNGDMTITAVTNTGPVEVTATEWQQVLLAAGAFRQPIWAASFALQSMNPIPAHYTEDVYWP